MNQFSVCAFFPPICFSTTKICSKRYSKTNVLVLTVVSDFTLQSCTKVLQEVTCRGTTAAFPAGLTQQLYVLQLFLPTPPALLLTGVMTHF